MKLSVNPTFFIALLVVVTLLPLINGQFFTKTSKSIPRMGRRSETDPISKASLLQAIYGQSETTLGNENMIREDQEVNQTNNPEYRLRTDDSSLDEERLFKELQDEKDEPEYTSIVSRNLKKVLRAYARKHRNEDLMVN